MLPLQKDQKDMKLVAMKRRMKDDAVDEGDKEIEGLADMFAEEEAVKTKQQRDNWKVVLVLSKTKLHKSNLVQRNMVR